MTELPDLTKLNEEQLRDVQARASALLGSTTSTTPHRGAEVWDAVVARLQSLGVHCPRYTVAVKLPRVGKLRDATELVRTFVTDHLKPGNKLARHKAYQILTKMLVRWMIARSIPVTHQTVAQNLGKIPALCSRQFPGYLESGLLPTILTAQRNQCSAV